MLLNKTVKIFTTTGAPTLIYKIMGVKQRLKKMFQKQIIEFCGMQLAEFNMYGGIDKTGTNTKDILSKMK